MKSEAQLASEEQGAAAARTCRVVVPAVPGAGRCLALAPFSTTVSTLLAGDSVLLLVSAAVDHHQRSVDSAHLPVRIRVAGRVPSFLVLRST